LFCSFLRILGLESHMIQGCSWWLFVALSS